MDYNGEFRCFEQGNVIDWLRVCLVDINTGNNVSDLCSWSITHVAIASAFNSCAIKAWTIKLRRVTEFRTKFSGSAHIFSSLVPGVHILENSIISADTCVLGSSLCSLHLNALCILYFPDSSRYFKNTHRRPNSCRPYVIWWSFKHNDRIISTLD